MTSPFDFDPNQASPSAPPLFDFDPTVAKPADAPKRGLISNIARTAAGAAVSGVGDIVSAIGEGGRLLAKPIAAATNALGITTQLDPVNGFERPARALQGYGEDISGSASPEFRRAMQETSALHPSTWSVPGVAGNVAAFTGGVVPLVAGAALTDGESLVAEAGTAAAKTALAEGATEAAAETAGKEAATAAAKTATRRQLLTGSALFGAQSGGGAMNEERQRIAGMSDAELAAVPDYQKRIAAGMAPDQARAAVADDAAQGVFLPATGVGAVGGLALGGPLAHGVQEAAGRAIGGGVVRKMVVGAGTDAALLGAQGVANQVATTEAANTATGETRDPYANLPETFVGNAIGGLPFGAYGGFRAHRTLLGAPPPSAEEGTPVATAQPVTRTLPDGNPLPDPNNGPLSRAVNIAAEDGTLDDAAAAAAAAAQAPEAPKPNDGSEIAPEDRLPGLTPWTIIDARDGTHVRIAQPTDDDIAAELNRRMDTMAAAGAVRFQKKVLFDGMALPAKRLNTITLDVMRARDEAAQAATGESADGAGTAGSDTGVPAGQTGALDLGGGASATGDAGGAPTGLGEAESDNAAAGAPATGTPSEPLNDLFPTAGSAATTENSNGQVQAASPALETRSPEPPGVEAQSAAGHGSEAGTRDANTGHGAAAGSTVRPETEEQRRLLSKGAAPEGAASTTPEKGQGTSPELALRTPTAGSERSPSPSHEEQAAAQHLRAPESQQGNDQGQATPFAKSAPDASAIQAAAREAAMHPANDLAEPTDAQKEAGNYQKGHIRVAGLDISIENPAGTRRRPEWPPLAHHYGYIKGTIGKDKDHVDVFLTPHAADTSRPVFVVDQQNKAGGFDEHKVVLGASTPDEARAAYLANYTKGWKAPNITQMSHDQFKAWVYDKTQTVKPAAAIATRSEPAAPPEKQSVALARVLGSLEAPTDADRKALGLPARMARKDAIRLYRNITGADEQAASITVNSLPRPPGADAGARFPIDVIAAGKQARDAKSENRTEPSENRTTAAAETKPTGVPLDALRKDKAYRAALKGMNDQAVETSHDVAQGWTDAKAGQKPDVTRRVDTAKLGPGHDPVDGYISGYYAGLSDGVGKIAPAQIRTREAGSFYEHPPSLEDVAKELAPESAGAAKEPIAASDNARVHAEEAAAEIRRATNAIGQIGNPARNGEPFKGIARAKAVLNALPDPEKYGIYGSEEHGYMLNPVSRDTGSGAYDRNWVDQAAHRDRREGINKLAEQNTLVTKGPSQQLRTRVETGTDGKARLFDTKTGEEVTPAKATDAVAVLKEQQALTKRLRAGDATLAEYKEGWKQLEDNRASILQHLGTMTKDDLLPLAGPRYRNEKKSAVVEAAMEGIEQRYGLNRSISYNITFNKADGDPRIKALREQIESTSEADLQAYAKEHSDYAAGAKARAAGMTDPQTLDDYARLSRELGGEAKLLPEQRQRFDELRVEARQADREAEAARNAVVRRVDTGDTSMSMVETKHTQKGHALFVVKLADRVEKETYSALNSAAKRLGGYYSSFRGNGAIPGFQFTTHEAAEKFMAVRDGNVSAADQQQARQEGKTEKRAETLAEKAAAVRDRGEAKLNADRKDNTRRRAAQAAGAEADARKEIAIAGTMANIAKAIEDKKAGLLSHVNAKTQVDLLDLTLRRAHWDSLRDQGVGWEKAQAQPITADAVRSATLPKFWLTRGDASVVARKLISTRGGKAFGTAIAKHIDYGDEYAKAVQDTPYKFVLGRSDGKMAYFPTKTAAARALAASADKVRGVVVKMPRAGKTSSPSADWAVALSPELAIERKLWQPDYDQKVHLNPESARKIVDLLGDKGAPIDSRVPYWWESNLAERDAFARMGIARDFELREALRQYLKLRQGPAGEDKVRALERALPKDAGVDFFPTPPAVVSRLVEQADIGPGMRVLEPSAGKGDIAEALRDAADNVQVDTGEMSSSLRDILEAKGFEPKSGDFLQHEAEPVYDRIVMNPPFGNDNGAAHVRHAYDMLKPGGKLVAVMGDGSRGREAFDQWLESVGGLSEQLPEGSFKSSFRPTGVQTRVVEIEKSEAKPQFSKEDGETPSLRTHGIPATIGEPLSLFRNDQPLKRNPNYAAAKAGDVEAAAKLVREIALPLVAKARARFGDGAIYVAPHAEEASGRNKIPQVLAAALANATNGIRDDAIVQDARAFHTGADYMQRIASRPTFDGDVVKGGRYVLVDDVTQMGGTLAELANHIQRNGGTVEGVVTLTNAARSGKLAADAKMTRKLEGRFGDDIRQNLHVEPSALTHEEAQYLTGFRTADELRNRIATARQETSRRIRAKGLFRLAPSAEDLTNAPQQAGRSGSGLSIADGQRLKATLTKDWGSDAPRVVLVENAEGFPSSAKVDPGYVRAKGLYDGKPVVYLNLDKIKDAHDFGTVLAHEALGHYGVEHVVGAKDWGGIVDTIERIDRSGTGAQSIRDAIATARKREGANVDRVTLAKEAIAVMAERGVRNGLVDRVITAVRRQLRKLMPSLQWNEADIRGLLSRADSFLHAGETRAEHAAAMQKYAFAKKPDTFYSALVQAVDEAKDAPKKADAAAWKGWLDGAQRRGEIKGSERQWMGVDAWLDSQSGPITRADLADFVRQHQVEVSPVRLGKNDAAPNQNQLRTSVVDLYRQIHPNASAEDLEAAEASAKEWVNGDLTTADVAHDLGVLQSRLESIKKNGNPDTTKFGEYQLPGGQNYREHLLTLPNRAEFDPSKVDFTRKRLSVTQGSVTLHYDGKDLGTWDDSGSIANNYRRPESELREQARRLWEHGDPINRIQSVAGGFRSNHWDEPNVLAHVRMNDRTTADGKKALHIEEIQSDWHQKGRREGYAGSQESTVIAALKEYEGLMERMAAVGLGKMTAADRARIDELRPIVRGQGHGTNAVPDAPLKKTEDWAMLGFKHALREAVETGKDKVTWTTGDQQNARYDLSKHVDSVFARRDKMRDGYEITVTGKNGAVIFDNANYAMDPAKLADHVGKEMADKIVSDLTEPGQSHTYSGLDLKVGGEGMKAFYDKMLPSAVGKYVKQWGGKVGAEKITKAGHFDLVGDTIHPSSETVHSVDITPAMRDSVEEGQPLFSKAADDGSDERETTPERPMSDKEAADTRATPAVEQNKPGTVVLSPKSNLSVRQWMGSKITDIKPHILATIPLNFLSDFAHPKMTAVKDYLRLVDQMSADRNHLHKKYAEVAQRWSKYATEGMGVLRGLFGKRANANGLELASLMHEATLAGTDPSKDFAPGTFKDRIGREQAITPKNVRDQVKAINEQMRGRSADSKKLMMDDVRALKSKLAAEPARKDAHGSLSARYAALPEEGKALFGLARDSYQEQVKLLEKTLEDNMGVAMDVRRSQIERQYDRRVKEINESDSPDKQAHLQSAADKRDKAIKHANDSEGSRIIALRQKFESMRVEAPYFPLKRFGNYFVSSKIGGALKSYDKFENFAAAEAFAKKQAAAGYNTFVGRDSEKDDIEGAVDPRFIAEVDELLSEAKVDPSVRDAIYQMHLESQPSMSMRSSFIHRKKTPGYSADALRAYGSTMFHGSYQISRLKYAAQMGETLNTIEDQANKYSAVDGMALSNEMRKRHDWVMNPTGGKAAQAISTTAFTWYLGANPAQLFINSLQTPMLGIPIIGSKYGFGETSRELARAMRDFTAGRGHIEKSNLTPGEMQAAQEFQDSGLWEKTQSHDIAGIGDTGVEYSALRHSVMNKLSYFFHQSERFNREVTSIAAYRLARADGMAHPDAVERARDLTVAVHFNYDAANRPRILQGDIAKALLVFRNYNVNVLYRIFRDIHDSFRGESRPARIEAAKQLGALMGMYGLMAGVTGLPFYGVAMSLASMFDDDDDPFGAEEKFKQGTQELLGEDAANYLLKGVPGTALNIDLTQRLGMPNLWFRSPDRELEGQDAYHFWMDQMLGAGVSLGANAFEGLKLMHHGNIERGVETMLPALGKEPLRAMRFAAEGQATNLNDEKVADVGPGGVIAQMLGFTPQNITTQYDVNSALKGGEAKLQMRRQLLMDRYAAATLQSDPDTAQDTMQRIIAFNQANPAFRITADTLQSSLRTRIRNEAMSTGGVVMSKRLTALAQQRAALAAGDDDGE